MKQDIRATNETERQVFSVSEVASILGLGRGAVYQAVAAGQIPHRRIGGRILVPRCQLERFLEGDVH